MNDAHLAARLVRDAGALAQRMRAVGLQGQEKTSISDVVTEADHAAEKLVVDALAIARPRDGVLGEEGADRVGTTGRTWVIDPVDGTYNFLAGLDWWCSAIALTDGEDLVLGAIHHPATDQTFVGGPDLPTTVNGVPLAQIEDRPLRESCLTTYLHPPFFRGEVGAVFGRMASRAATIRMLGSGSMDAVAVAEGRLHVLCQHSVPPWDELPGAAIILGAGGRTEKVSAAGKYWSVAGVPTAVGDVVTSLTGPVSAAAPRLL